MFVRRHRVFAHFGRVRLDVEFGGSHDVFVSARRKKGSAPGPVCAVVPAPFGGCRARYGVLLGVAARESESCEDVEHSGDGESSLSTRSSRSDICALRNRQQFATSSTQRDVGSTCVKRACSEAATGNGVIAVLSDETLSQMIFARNLSEEQSAKALSAAVRNWRSTSLSFPTLQLLHVNIEFG